MHTTVWYSQKTHIVDLWKKLGVHHTHWYYTRRHHLKELINSIKRFVDLIYVYVGVWGIAQALEWLAAFAWDSSTYPKPLDLGRQRKHDLVEIWRHVINTLRGKDTDAKHVSGANHMNWVLMNGNYYGVENGISEAEAATTCVLLE